MLGEERGCTEMTVLPLGHGDYLSFQVKSTVGSVNKLSGKTSKIYMYETGYRVFDEYRKALHPLYSFSL